MDSSKLGWIVSQLSEPVNDYALLDDKGGALSNKSQAVLGSYNDRNVLKIQQLEE